MLNYERIDNLIDEGEKLHSKSGINSNDQELIIWQNKVINIVKKVI